LYYKVTANGTNTLTLDTEGDSLLLHALPGNAMAALAIGDGIKIRPYFRIRDVFENPAASGTPILEGRAVAAMTTVGDEIKFTSYTALGINKAAALNVFYVTGTSSWTASAAPPTQPATVADWVLRPNEAFVVRNRNAGSIELTNTGWVVMNKMISFVPGGDASNGNDIFISINRPAPVKLDDSGLAHPDSTQSFIKHSTSAIIINQRQDELLTWTAGSGFSRAATARYVYVGGQGWRDTNNVGNTTVGQTTFLQPGQAYIVRKKANSVGKDWVNDANY